MLLPDGSPSRDRLARIAAMIQEAEKAATGRGELAADDARPIPLFPRAKRARLRTVQAAVVDLAG